MSDLVVFAFDNETGAADMAQAVKGLQKQELIRLEDAATVVRKQDGKPKVKQAQSLVGAGALGGSFWGLLIGLLFWAPWLGLAIGAARPLDSSRAMECRSRALRFHLPM